MSRLSRALYLTLTEYFKKTSLNGFGLLHFLRRRRYQRFFWFLFIAVGIAFASFVVFTTFWQFLAQPTVTSLSTLSAEIDEVPLPQITICSANKLSRRRVEQFALELSLSTGRTRRYWLQQLPLLAGYFAPAVVSPQAAAALQAALGDHWRPRDVRAQLIHMSPSCEELLLSCHVEGNERNCTQLFRLLPTIEGCCCILQAEPEQVSGELSLRLNATRADDFRMPRAARGQGAFSVHLPGWQARVSVAQGDWLALEVRALKLHADLQLRSYPLAERACHFADEAEQVVMCLPRCRLLATLAACHCAPYFFDLTSTGGNISYCNLSHTACLQQFEGKWGVGWKRGDREEGREIPLVIITLSMRGRAACLMDSCLVDSCNWFFFCVGSSS